MEGQGEGILLQGVLFEEFIVGKKKVHVPILQFAEDTLLFCKYDDGMLTNLRQTIALFEWCSGQKVNWEKSALFGINVEDKKLLSTTTSLNCKANHLPCHYLGLPLGGYPKSVSFWHIL